MILTEGWVDTKRESYDQKKKDADALALQNTCSAEHFIQNEFVKTHMFQRRNLKVTGQIRSDDSSQKDAMKLQQGPRATLAFTLNCLAFALAVSAVTTSYWCSGTRKVVKPLCTGPAKIKQNYCIHFNSSDVNNTHLVQYIYETGEEMYILKKFHTGIWFTCEQSADLLGFTCRTFLEIAPDHERGVLWLCIIGECLYITLLFIGVSLMAMDMSHCGNRMNQLKLNAFAALFTALSGLFGMVAHMMFTTAFQLTVILGPEDWKPKNWDYSWSYLLAWVSFATCMASAVTSLNHYTKTIIQFKFKRKNIVNNLELLGLHMPVGLWDTYLSSGLDPTDQHMSFEVKVTPDYFPLHPKTLQHCTQCEEYS